MNRKFLTDPIKNILENSNADISATDHPIHSILGARVWFSGSADRTVLFLV